MCLTPCVVSTQIDNGKHSDHEQTSVMEHLRLILATMSLVRLQRPEAPGLGEWQEDSGLGLYRAPEDGATATAATDGGGAAASGQTFGLDHKVGLIWSDAFDE